MTEAQGSPNELAKSVLLLIVQFIASIATTAFVWVESMRVAGCGDQCDYALLGSAVRGAFILVIGIFLASLASVVWLARQRRTSWPVPAVGTGLIISIGVVATILVRLATS